jgi:hypothetical protein
MLEKVMRIKIKRLFKEKNFITNIVIFKINALEKF